MTLIHTDRKAVGTDLESPCIVTCKIHAIQDCFTRSNKSSRLGFFDKTNKHNFIGTDEKHIAYLRVSKDSEDTDNQRLAILDYV